MTNTPKIGARLTLVTSEGILLNQWDMDEWNLDRNSACIDLGLEIHDQIVKADRGLNITSKTKKGIKK